LLIIRETVKRRADVKLLCEWLWISSLLILVPATAWAQADTAQAFTPETTYEFGAVVEGVAVIHDFVIRNKGTDLLQIHQVKPG